MKKQVLVLIPAVMAGYLLSLHAPVAARPEFAQLTGQPCSNCHISPQGGGALRPEGEQFRQNLKNLDIPLSPRYRVSTGRRLLHLAFYLLHIPFGVAWVGLFYLTFGPALRRKALVIPPKPYIRQMIYGAVVILLTGPSMVLYRMKTVPGMFGTRFGILLLAKAAAALVLLLATLTLIWRSTVVLTRRYRRLARSVEQGLETDLTRDDLLLFDGAEKRKALVAVEGKIYDVTGRNLWRRGIHPGGHRAGHDLSGAFSEAPHGREVFDRVLPVGRLAAEDVGEKGRSARWAVLAGMAGSVIILLVVALWRW
ncbi:MAG: hypothetical protein JSV00_05110 [bacterium]|nr:MAG: hypothetical protein JSV00_05110 [bacterium]